MNVIATMNAGSIPANVWVHNMKIGGGRIIGEACHYIDLITFMTGSKIKSVCMNAMGTNPNSNTDNASILLAYENGSTIILPTGQKNIQKKGWKFTPKNELWLWIISYPQPAMGSKTSVS